MSYLWVRMTSWLQLFWNKPMRTWTRPELKTQKGFYYFFSPWSDPNKPNHWCESTQRTFKSGSRCRLRWSSIRDGGKPKNVYFCNDSKPMWHVSCCVLLLNSSRVVIYCLLCSNWSNAVSHMRLTRIICIFKLLRNLCFPRTLYMCMNNSS